LCAPGGTVVEPVRAYLFELSASDYRTVSVKSYAYALLDWFRLLPRVAVEHYEHRF
jgi:hypothetical protein